MEIIINRTGQYVTRADNGDEYSTVVIGGYAETCLFYADEYRSDVIWSDPYDGTRTLAEHQNYHLQRHATNGGI
jgi:hypothetical protein